MKLLFIFLFLSITPFFSDGNEDITTKLNFVKTSQKDKDLESYLNYKREQNKEIYLLMN